MDFLKLNFDGASKGNLVQDGYGGIFWDWEGWALNLYVVSCWIKSNNVVEFLVLERCLVLSINEGYLELQIDGDS